MPFLHRQNDELALPWNSPFSVLSGILNVSVFRKGGVPVGGNYEKSVYNQLMEVMEKLNSMESEHSRDRKEVTELTTEVTGLRKENAYLREEVSNLKQKTSSLEEENTSLKAENRLLHDDNERMKRILDNDSSNSSTPPSKDEPGKAPNTFNGRKPTKRKAGAQPGHKGSSLSKIEVEQNIQEGVYRHRVEHLGTPGRAYITRYRLDLEVTPIATEIRIYADRDGKFQVPGELKAEVSYGGTVKAIAAFLYSEGVVANDRICTFINSLSGDKLHLSTGSVYGFCKKFAQSCAAVRTAIEQELLNSNVICTDATPVKTDGKQTHIRNFSTETCVLYCSSEKKDLKTLGDFKILKEFTGTLIHDHETALYHFGTRHGECNVHLERYLLKNTEETGNTWSHKLRCFLEGMNQARKKRILLGDSCFTRPELERYCMRYEELLLKGIEENKHTKGRIAKKEEKALLKRLKKYQKNHLLFLYDFRIPYSNNRSEKDLRICKNRQKMAGGFRTAAGRQMYCEIMSLIETIKRRGLNIFQGIIALMNSAPAIR